MGLGDEAVVSRGDADSRAQMRPRICPDATAGDEAESSKSVTPIAAVAYAASAPVSYSPPYVAPAAIFNTTDYAAPAPTYYAPAYYAPPARVYYAPPAPVYYSAPAPRYYAPPVRYYAPAPVHYA